jgi:hypothetical protein
VSRPHKGKQTSLNYGLEPLHMVDAWRTV